MTTLTLPDPTSALRARRSRSSGFTLVEILIVLAIIGLLVGLTVTKFTGVFASSQVKIAKLFVTTSMETALMAYQQDMGDYPSTDEGLMALYVPPQDAADKWHGPYAKGGKPPLDPWSQPYHYRYPGVHNKGGYDIWSTGPDKTDGSDDNIGNW